MNDKTGGPATDRELLEMAAKAAGYIGFIDEMPDGPVFVVPGFNPFYFQPLTDDGDALRLVVKLSLVINSWHRKSLAEDMDGKQFWEDHEGDDFAATRRAIVRAAAAIGSAM